jgi:small subunit ribosomal protein S21
VEIKVEGKDIEKALKLLKRKVQRDGLMGELKKRRYYEKPSVKLKSKQREAARKKAKSARRKAGMRQTAARD